MIVHECLEYIAHSLLNNLHIPASLQLFSCKKKNNYILHIFLNTFYCLQSFFLNFNFILRFLIYAVLYAVQHPSVTRSMWKARQRRNFILSSHQPYTQYTHTHTDTQLCQRYERLVCQSEVSRAKEAVIGKPCSPE